MKHFVRKLNATVAASALAVSSLLANDAFANNATQGSLGTTSTGTIDINVTKTTEVQLSGLNDANFQIASWSIASGTALSMYSNACVYTDDSNGYTITASGSGTSGAFTLVDAATQTITYTVTWNHPGYVGGFTDTGSSLATGVPSGTLTNASPDSADCSGGVHSGMNSRVYVDISSTVMTEAAAGTYQGTLTLLVNPV